MSTSIFQKIVANLTPVAPGPVMGWVIMHDRRVSQLLRKDTGGNTSGVEDTRIVARRTIICRSGRAGVTGGISTWVRPWKVEWTPGSTYRPVLPLVFPDPYPVEPVLS